MMNTLRVGLCLGFLAACGSSVASDLYRCDMVNGKTTYQGTQCGLDAQQRAIDPRNARREQIKRTLDEQRRHKEEEKVTTEKDQPA